LICGFERKKAKCRTGLLVLELVSLMIRKNNFIPLGNVEYKDHSDWMDHCTAVEIQ